MAVKNRQELIDYCLRELGEPVVEINVAEEQIEDRVDEAIEYYRQYHWDGIEKVYLKHELTQEDLDNRYIEIPDLIYGVTKVFPLYTGTTNSQSIFNLQYQIRLHDLYDLTSTSVIYYEQVRNHLSLLEHVLNGHQLYRFNRLTNKLYIDTNLDNKLEPGNFILVECYRALDPNDVTRMYNETWLKAYTAALIKRQWATNMKKFQGLQLPGGVSIDAQGMYEEAENEIKSLREDLMNKQGPLEFMLG